MVIVGLALGLFLFVPFAPESISGPRPGGHIDFTVSLSCFLTGDNPLTVLGDSYSPQISVNGNHLFYGCHLGNTPIS